VSVPTSNFLPAAVRIPNSIGLSLSGGGFRATLFHLGAIRRLNEFGVMPRLTSISSVSGGSILNGFLASRLNPPLSSGVADYENSVSQPMRQFCSLDIRRWPGVEALVPGTHNSTGLAKAYNEHLTLGKKLAEIAATPHYIFCSTDLAYGVNWTFRREQCGDYQAGYMTTSADWLVSTARDQCVRGITFSDGGVYDNLGLEPIWKTHETVLASDGGALFAIGGDTGFSWEIGRFIGIPENQALAVRKRWLISNFHSGQLKGTYWGIGTTVAEYKLPGSPPGYSEDLVRKFIAPIRTDLDCFSDGEASVLENHGYLLADAAIRAWVPQLLPTPVPGLAIPHPEWMDENKVQAALKDSSKRSILGRSHSGGS